MLPHFHRNLKSSFCCFHSSHQRHFLHSPSKTPPTSPCSLLKSTASQLSHLLHRCRYFLARIARRRNNYLASLDFTYDSSSYALNFEDDCHHHDQFPFRDFTARFPPPLKKERLSAPNFAGPQDGIAVSACA